MHLHTDLRLSRKRLNGMSICKISASVSTITVISNSCQDAHTDILTPFGKVICIAFGISGIFSSDSNDCLNLLLVSWCAWSHHFFHGLKCFLQSPKRHAVARRCCHDVHFHNEWQFLCVKCVRTPHFNGFKDDWYWRFLFWNPKQLLRLTALWVEDTVKPHSVKRTATLTKLLMT